MSANAQPPCPSYAAHKQLLPIWPETALVNRVRNTSAGFRSGSFSIPCSAISPPSGCHLRLSFVVPHKPFVLPLNNREDIILARHAIVGGIFVVHGIALHRDTVRPLTACRIAKQSGWDGHIAAPPSRCGLDGLPHAHGNRLSEQFRHCIEVGCIGSILLLDRNPSATGSSGSRPYQDQVAIVS